MGLYYVESHEGAKTNKETEPNFCFFLNDGGRL